MTRKPCVTCGAPSDGWPAYGGGELCQEHWEAETDAEWWTMMTQLAEAADA